MGFMFCDLHVSLNNPLSGDINSSNLPCWLRFWLNCGLRSITFGGMQHCHSNLTLIKHYKIQAKFEFGGHSPIFD